MSENTIEVGRAEYLSAAETAKLVRKALAKAFPGYEFSVRSASYANGASVYVDYYDGPPAVLVRDVVDGYSGGGFDGMIDLAYHVESWLDADGTAYVAGSPGSSGSGGMHSPFVQDPPSPNARLVHFGADHVLVQRAFTPEGQAVLDRAVERKYGVLGNEYQDDYKRTDVVNRRLFPPTRFTYEVSRGYNAAHVVEAVGITSKSAAEKVARENQKNRTDGVRGYRNVTAHRAS